MSAHFSLLCLTVLDIKALYRMVQGFFVEISAKKLGFSPLL
jgi:hypothetical protein